LLGLFLLLPLRNLLFGESLSLVYELNIE
jgi:hypothetical protein